MEALVADLWPWLAALLVLDGVLQLRRGQVAVVPGGRGILGPGLHLAGLGPAAEVLDAADLPALPAPEGVFVFDPRRRDASAVVGPEELTLVPWGRLGDLRAEGRVVTGGGRVLYRALSAEGAAAVARRLAAVRDAPEASRQAAVSEGIAAGFDLSATRRRREAVAAPSRALTLFSTLELAVIFALFPALAWAVPAAPARWAEAAAALAILHAATLCLGFAVARRAGATAGAALGAMAPALFFWPIAGQARAHALRGRFADLEPLALVAVHSGRSHLLQLGRRELVRAAASAETTAALGLSWYWEARRRAAERLLVEAGAGVAEALSPPPREPDAQAFCPLCHGAYRAGFDRCNDCRLPLRRYPAPGPARA